MKQIVILLLALSLTPRLVAGQPKNCKVLTSEFIFDSAPFKQCHASTIAELADGSLIASWFGGTHESHKDVEIWVSTNKSGNWSFPASVANGIISESLRYPCWNPVLVRISDQKLSLYYKVGPNPREWWGMVIHSTDEGKTWSAPERLPEGFLGPIKNKPVKLPSGIILSPSSTETSEAWKAHIERSADQGKSWEKIAIDPENPAKVIQPTLLLFPGGKIQALLRSNQNYIMESWSYDEGKTWSPLAKTKVLNPNSGIDAVTLHSGLQVLVYNPKPSGKSWENGRNKLVIATSTDGRNWEDMIVLEDQPSGEFSYPSIIEDADNNVHLVYTYNRKLIKHAVLKF